MKRSFQNTTEIVVRELNRVEYWPFQDGSRQVYEPETARHLRVIADWLRQLDVRQAGERDAIGRVLSRPRFSKAVIGGASLKKLPDAEKVGATVAERLTQLGEKTQARRAGEWIVGIFEAGKIDRLRKCRRCQKWFFAHRGNQRVCGNSCRSQLWQAGKGEKKHKQAWRKWWIRNCAIDRIKGQLEKFPKARPLTTAEARRKQWYLHKQARYERELARLEKRKSVKGE